MNATTEQLSPPATGECPRHKRIAEVLYGIAIALILAICFGTHTLCINGPCEARLWLPVAWAACMAVLLFTLRPAGNDGPAPALWVRLAAAPTGAEIAFVLLWLGSYLVLGSDATYPQIGALSDWQGWDRAWVTEEYYYSFPFLLLGWIVLRILFLGWLVNTGRLDSSVGAIRRRWLHISLVTVAVIVCWTHLDLVLRVRFSDSYLRGYVKDHLWLQQHPPPHVNQGHLRSGDGYFSSSMSESCGLFTVHHTTSREGVVWIDTVRRGPPFGAGLCYCEHGEPPVVGENTYQHLYGPWWRWLWDM